VFYFFRADHIPFSPARIPPGTFLRCGDQTTTIPERKAKVHVVRWRIPSRRFPYAAKYFFSSNARQEKPSLESIPQELQTRSR